MTQVTVKELAQVVDTPVERLLQQMRERVGVLRQGSCRISGFESDHTVGVWLTRE